ncbi:MAG: hypothetical protein C5B47_06970 [Verrucomicrobia bacterium]|nr:MAG: hypothetical protein C5B47_06970 [Verrucomicrobiota bacterium]
MKFTCTSDVLVSRLLFGGVLFAAVTSAFSQVSPTEIANPRAKADEQKYLQRLVSLQQSIGKSDFPFTFRLARYLDAKPGQRAALDSNGIEFVSFQQRVVLKISGFYRVAYDSMQLTRNARATQVMQEAILPILRLVTSQIPQSSDYDGIGFEVLYDARDSRASYDFEGHEVLTAVFSRDEAFALAKARTNAEIQEIVDRSDIYVNAKPFGLELGQRDPHILEAAEQPAPPKAEDDWSSSVSDSLRRAVDTEPTLTPAISRTRPASMPTSADQATLPSDGPLPETDGDQKLLHFTMQNTLSFEKAESSIYKRAAQSFDLFLAPELKGISKKLPTDASYDGLHFSVLNNLGAEKSETIEYICPMDSMRAFVENKITSQDLINKSTVLVNGVRIGLTLQLVE